MRVKVKVGELRLEFAFENLGSGFRRRRVWSQGDRCSACEAHSIDYDGGVCQPTDRVDGTLVRTRAVFVARAEVTEGGRG